MPRIGPKEFLIKAIRHGNSLYISIPKIIRDKYYIIEGMSFIVFPDELDMKLIYIKEKQLKFYPNKEIGSNCWKVKSIRHGSSICLSIPAKIRNYLGYKGRMQFSFTYSVHDELIYMEANKKDGYI